MLVGSLDLGERRTEQVDHLALDALADSVLVLVGVVRHVVQVVLADGAAAARPRTAAGRPAANGWRITGMSMPGMRSSQARSSGFGSVMKSANAGGTGIVDHRFDHIDSGKLSPSGARAYLRRPSVTCTQLPNTPPIAQSRTEVASPVSSGTSDRPCVRCAGRDAEHVGDRGVRSTFVVSASHVAAPDDPATR